MNIRLGVLCLSWFVAGMGVMYLIDRVPVTSDLLVPASALSLPAVPELKPIPEPPPMWMCQCNMPLMFGEIPFGRPAPSLGPDLLPPSQGAGE